MKLPTLQQGFEYLATKDDQLAIDLLTLATEAVSHLVMGWAWTRQLRGAGVLLQRVRSGEKLAKKEAAQLAKLLTWSTYYLARHWAIGVRGSENAMTAHDRIRQESRKSSVPPPSSDKWQELHDALKDLAKQASEIKARQNNAPSSSYGA